MKNLWLGYCFLFLSWGYAQQVKVKGVITDADTSKPVAQAIISIQGMPDVYADTEGAFVLSVSANSPYYLQISVQGYENLQIPLEVETTDVDLGNLLLNPQMMDANPSVVLISEEELENDESSVDAVSGLLQSTQDVFMRKAAFDFGQVFFRPRGYDSKDAQVLLNGISINKIDNGRPQWSNWGGLNDVTRNQELTIGLNPSEYTFGGLFGSNYIDLRPSLNRPGLRISSSASNRSYNGRVMATYSSGVQKNGLSYSFSASRRWAPTQGYVEGTQYNAYSLFGGVEYQINRKHSVNLVGIFTPNRHGKSSPLTQEAIDLAGYRYNPMWGDLDGSVRNSRQKIVSEPIFIASYKYNNDFTRANLNIGYQFGTIGNTRIQYANGQNPEPNYYKNMPSYYLNGKNGPQPDVAELQRAYFLENKQLDWESLYQANTRQGGDGRSVYIISNDRNDERTFTGNFDITTPINENINITLGGTYRNITSENYAQIEDLLGGWYYMNKDYFSGKAYNSLENSSEMRKSKGDKYNYDYLMNSNVAEFFTQLHFTYGKAKFFVAGEYQYTDYQRDGKYKNPSFTDSYGLSGKRIFRGVSTKAGLTYALMGRHIFQVNTGYFNSPQNIRNTFANVRNSNQVVPNLENENTFTADASYILRMPFVKARLTGYYIYIKNAYETNFFFTQSALALDVDSDFVTQTIKGIEKQHFGMELGAEVQILPTLKATTAIALGQYTYANNPSMLLSSDEISNTYDEVYLKNYHTSGGPQRAYSLGLEYRSPRYWWVAASANYLTHNYISIAGITRTSNFFIDKDTQTYYTNIDKDLARYLLRQERLDPVFLVNLIGGKSWRIKGNYLSLFAGINNVLGTSYKSGGFEQSRTANYADMVRDNAQGIPSFGPRYFMGYGRTYFINIALSL